MMFKNLFSLIAICIAFCGFKPMEPKNYYKVSDTLYRSAQIKKCDLTFLKLNNFKAVLNLRKHRNNHRELKGSEIQDLQLRIKTSDINEHVIIEALKAYSLAPKPVLVHCRRGIDRTGAFVACYRIVFEHWTREAAIDEFLDPRFGYNEKLFPGVLRFLQECNIELIKNECLRD